MIAILAAFLAAFVRPWNLSVLAAMFAVGVIADVAFVYGGSPGPMILFDIIIGGGGWLLISALRFVFGWRADS